MLSQEGLRVVRGPDWKWGDQDGGIGHAGTIIPTSEYDKKKLGPQTITVLWDCGKKAVYQGGPKGSHHLRVIDNTSTGVKHTNISCGNDSCWVQEILGTRWQCTTCEINLCTNCFLKKVPHNVEHVKFKRFTSDERDVKPSIVRCWGVDGPDSRIELKGFYPGATVYMGPEWPYRREEETKRGLVVSAPKEEISGKILVEWHPSKERTRHQRSNSDGRSVLKLKEPGISGYYHPEALAAVEVDIADVNPRPAFSVGDRVQIDPTLKKDDISRKQVGHGGVTDWLKDYVGGFGTVVSMDEKSSVKVQFKNDPGSRHEYTNWRFNPDVLTRLNEFSVDQVIRIRNDECTIRSIGSKFMQSEIRQKLIGAIGRVAEVNENDPSRLYVKFDDNEIYRWLSKRIALPSAWMKPFGMADLAVEKEIAASIKKTVSLFFNAVDRGDLSNAKIFHLHHTIVADARNANGESALHVACIKGHKDIVEWLIDDVKVDIEKSSKIGHRPIHYAVRHCNTGILGLLIERGVDVDSQTTNSKCTALHFAAMHNHTECCRLLIDGECDANIQDVDGNTPLHYAIYTGNSLCIHQILSRVSINFELRSNTGFNVFHVAVVKGDLKAIELMMEQENMDDPLLEFMPDSKSTVLHYACSHKYYQVAKLLVNKSKTKIMPNGSSLLKHLLEVQNETNMSALLVASKLRDPALIELLVEAGTNCEALDEESNSALLLAASSLAEDRAPTKELCPSIFEVYQRLGNDPDLKDVENKTVLSIILFFMSKGCCVNAVNKSGLKLSDILLPDKGYPKNIIKLLKQFFQRRKREPFSGSGGCMGRTGCSHRPAYQLSCPHKAIYKACSTCFLPTADEFKCGCPEEKIGSIQTAASSSSGEVSSSVKTRIKEEREETKDIGLKWVDDGTKNGKVTDRMGNTYLRSGTRMDGGIGYRCLAPSAVGRKERCTAVARRYIKDGVDTVDLESQHTKHDQDDLKCEYPEEKILPIPNCSSAEVSSSIGGTQIKEEQIVYELKLVCDGTKNGKVGDQIGNEYIWSGIRKDGAIGYRCIYHFGRKNRCPAVARRFIKSNEDGTDKILLESPHKHPEAKRKLDCINVQDGDPLTPSFKKKRSSVNEAKH